MSLLSKFKYLVKYGIKKRLGTKAFIISNVILFILMLVVFNIPNIIKAFDDGEPNGQLIFVVNNLEDRLTDGEVQTLLAEVSNRYEAMLPDANIRFENLVEFDDSDVNNINYFKSSGILVLSLNGDHLSAKFYEKELDLTNKQVLELTLTEIRTNIWAEGKTPEELELIEEFLQPLDFTIITQVEDNSIRDMILGVLGMLISIPVFMLLVMSVQFVGTDIIEEKSTKAIEFVMSTVPPRTHFLSKIIAAFSFLLAQSLLILVYTLVAGLISTTLLGAQTGGGLNIPEMIGQLTQTDSTIISDVLGVLPQAVVVMLLFTIIGGLMYMIIMAVLASMSTTMEDFQQFQSPMMIVMMIGFYGAIFSFSAGPNLFLKILAYIPLFAPTLVPTLFMSGALSLIDMLISLAILILFTVGVYYFLAPVYKASILSYDQSPFMKRIKKLFKRSKNL